MEANLAYIHIGKAAGSSLGIQLRNFYPDISYYHHKRDYDLSKKYIFFVRNPLTRFVSAFNYSRHLVTYNCTGKTPNEINISNCLWPPRIKRKIQNKTPYAFSNEYDSLVKFFKSANDLAEGLNSNNLNIKEKINTATGVNALSIYF
jgi:hypothetical protein